MSELKFAILVNTTDSFEDCWEPFFQLFRTFWPDYSGTIYLNTERKEFVYEGCNIISIKNGLVGSPWSTCLAFAISQIKEDSFIYMQEDYFLHSNVDHQRVAKLHKEFSRNQLDCLHLTDQCTKGPFIKDAVIDGLWAVTSRAPYRASTQAAFWTKDSLRRIIRPWESGWEFEEFGTSRSCVLLPRVYCVSHELCKKDDSEIVPYIFTGIVKGKWKQEVVPLFADHGIPVDFAERGFVEYGSSSWSSRVRSLLGRVLKILKNRMFEVIYLNNQRKKS